MVDHACQCRSHGIGRPADAGDHPAEAFAGSGLGRGPVPAGEDFGSFGTEWNAPSAVWFVGGTDADTYVGWFSSQPTVD